ncbi:MAG: hypothetical protein US69_C0011G0010 [candidate division TM6 bacterium GW2011_GWF2_38_10]|nr:MAG: hypothetical protein US69_C0011G0010 [candidate division TM6 bacterium GW2011_GWF2_38_10]
MKNCIRYLAFLYGIFTMGSAIHIDGTTNPVYKQYHHVFYNTSNTTSGFIRFDNGFTTTSGFKQPAATISLDINIPLSGPIDLHNYGRIILENNIIFDASITFSSGGYIEGNGKSITLQGNFTLPDNAALHCHGNLVINGKGNTLTIGDDAQLILDNDSTLTLRNMIIKTNHAYPGQPSLTISSSLSHLTLDNVVFEMGDDWYVNNGSLFFTNDVIFTGKNHGIVYQSTAPSFITDNSHLYLDHDITFSFAPTIPLSRRIYCKDESSKITCDGCSILATNTGMKIVDGTIIFKNNTKLNSLAGIHPAATTLDLSVNTGLSYIRAMSFSPNEQYIAVAGDHASSNVRVFKINTSSIDQVASAHLLNRVNCITWSPCGKYVAAANQASYASGINAKLYIFYFNGSSLQKVTDVDWGTEKVDGEGLVLIACIPFAIRFSPDSHYVAIAGLGATENMGGFDNRDQIRVYAFDGNSVTPVTSRPYGNSTTWARPYDLSWSNDGKYLLLGGRLPDPVGGFNNSHKIRLYYFTGTTLEPVSSIDLGGTSVYCVQFSPNNTYIITTPGDVGTGGTRPLQLVKFANNTLSLIDQTDDIACTHISNCAPNGQSVSALSGTLPGLRIYDCTNEELTQRFTQSLYNADGFSQWGLSGEYILVGRADGAGPNCRTFKITFGANAQEQRKSFITFTNEEEIDNTKIVLEGGSHVSIHGNIIV